MSEGWTIRPMEQRDIAAVTELERQIFSLPWTRKGFEDALSSPYTRYLCAWEREKLIGYTGYLRSFEDADITNVAVCPSFRNRGVGRSLLTRLMLEGLDDGIERYTLEVRVSNLPARALYERLGFCREGVRPGFYDRPKEDAIIMWTGNAQTTRELLAKLKKNGETE